MTDKQKSEVRATAAALETLDMGGVADLVRRQYAELETLRTGYAAARLEIESLKAQHTGAAYAALSDAEIDRIVPALEPVSEDFPVEWALWKDRGRIRNELRADSAPADSQPASDEIIRMAREAGLPETETEGVFRVNADDLGRIFASYRAARAPADSVTAPAGGVVAYLDIGAGGYLDLGTDLSNEALSRLPKGRNELVIAGTYGIDGYTPTPPTQAADSVLEDEALLDFIAQHPEMSLRHRKGKWAFVGFTNYEYEMLPSLRDAIRAARKQGANHD